MVADDLFTPEQLAAIHLAIKKAEAETSGEIRLHLENKLNGDVMKRAIQVFHLLHMHKSKFRCSVLFYLSLNPRNFAVVGDEAIHRHVKEEFWETVKEHAISRFKEGKITEGLCEGIEMSGQMLKQYFPHNPVTHTKHTDDISFGQ